MSHTPNELAEQFPDSIAKMHELRASDAHFSRLFDEYHTLNRDIHRAETDIEPTDDFNLEDMRKKRLALLDEISPLLG